jgi:hypothetical protein
MDGLVVALLSLVGVSVPQSYLWITREMLRVSAEISLCRAPYIKQSRTRRDVFIVVRRASISPFCTSDQVHIH